MLTSSNSAVSILLFASEVGDATETVVDLWADVAFTAVSDTIAESRK